MSRQEAVSMIPPLLLDIQPHSRVSESHVRLIVPNTPFISQLQKVLEFSRIIFQLWKVMQNGGEVLQCVITD